LTESGRDYNTPGSVRRRHRHSRRRRLPNAVQVHRQAHQAHAAYRPSTAHRCRHGEAEDGGAARGRPV